MQASDHEVRPASPSKLGLHTAIKPLITPVATGEFNSPPKLSRALPSRWTNQTHETQVYSRDRPIRRRKRRYILRMDQYKTHTTNTTGASEPVSRYLSCTVRLTHPRTVHADPPT
eukprot:3089249-Pyramimonas_sp.AAC.1